MLYIFTTFLGKVGMHALSITNKKNVENDFQAESAYSHPRSILMIILTVCKYNYNL